MQWIRLRRLGASFRIASMAAMACCATWAHADWVIGQVAPMTGPAAMQSKAYAQGMRLYFEHINSAGGLHGQPIQLVTLDDRGRPEETVAQTERLIKEHQPVALAGFFGNRNLRALLDSEFFTQSKISIVGLHSNDLRVLMAPQMFSTRASVSEQVEKIAKHLSTLGMKKMALVYDERDAQDAKGLEAMVRLLLEEEEAELLGSYMLKSGTAATVETVQQLLKAQVQPQALIVVASSPMTAGFVESYRMEGGTSQVYASSDADIEQLSVRLPVEMMRGMSIAQVVPNPYRTNSRLSKELQDRIAKQANPKDYPISYALMEGYVNAKVLAEAMRRTQSLSSAKLADGMRGIRAVDFGGYAVNFMPGSQTGARFVDLSIVNAEGRVTQ